MTPHYQFKVFVFASLIVISRSAAVLASPVSASVVQATTGLLVNPNRICSGTLINPNIVMTAAHCLVMTTTTDPNTIPWIAPQSTYFVIDSNNVEQVYAAYMNNAAIGLAQAQNVGVAATLFAVNSDFVDSSTSLPIGADIALVALAVPIEFSQFAPAIGSGVPVVDRLEQILGWVPTSPSLTTITFMSATYPFKTVIYSGGKGTAPPNMTNNRGFSPVSGSLSSCLPGAPLYDAVVGNIIGIASDCNNYVATRCSMNFILANLARFGQSAIVVSANGSSRIYQ